MKKLLLYGLISVVGLLIIGSFQPKFSYADDAAFETPVAPNGSSDMFAGVKSSCTANTTGNVLFYTGGRGVVYGVVASTGAATDNFQLYNASATVNISAANSIGPEIPLHATLPTELNHKLGGGYGIRFSNGLAMSWSGTASADRQVCAYYLEH